MMTVSMSSRSIRHVCLAGVGEIQCLVSDGGGVGGGRREQATDDPQMRSCQQPALTAPIHPGSPQMGTSVPSTSVLPSYNI